MQRCIGLAGWSGLFILVALLAVSRITSPPDADRGVPGLQASFELVLSHLDVITREPHPVGSTAHTRVREYLVAEIEKTGAEFQVQQVSLSELSQNLRWVEEGDVHNIVVRLPGTQGGHTAPAVLVTAHYDTVPASFGAGDDGAAIAAMLELVRVFSAGAFANDLIFLFADAEEVCLCGARAFMQHPWADDVGMVLNFDSRGTSGSSLMFETSTGNGALLGHYSDAAIHPVASSLFYEIYKILPNNTDFTIYREAGMPGLNFAFAIGLEHYHTTADSMENLDPDTAYHQLVNMETMARHFADASLNSLDAEDVVFFDVLALFMVVYSPFVALCLAGISLLLFAALAWQTFTCQEKHRAGHFGFIFLMLPLLLLVFSLVGSGAGKWSVLDNQWALAGYIVVVCVLFALCLYVMGRYTSGPATALMVTGLWLTPAVLSSVFLVGTSYLFALPLLFVLLALVLRNIEYVSGRPRLATAISIIASLPVLIIGAQLTYVFYVALTRESLGPITGFALLCFALFWLLPSRVKAVSPAGRG